MAVMRLVGMDHHHLAGGAGLQAAAIVERLRTPDRQADGIGLVAVQVVGMAAEARRQPLQLVGSVEVDVVLRSHAQTFKTMKVILPDMGTMIYETKTALVIRRDLAGWQMANVAAFLAGGLAGTHGHMMGEPYKDATGRAYTPLIREPVFVYGGTVEELRRTHQRALSRELVPAVYIEAMFTTTNDADNRTAFAAAPVDALDFVGIGVHGPRKTVAKVVNSLKFLS